MLFNIYEYRDNIFIKDLISKIPHIGLPIAEAWSKYLDLRMEKTVMQLSHMVNEIKEEKIDKEQIIGEAFIDFLNRALGVLLHSSSEKKVKIILNMIIESVKKDRDLRFSYELKENFLFILEKLTDYEIDFLCEFAQYKYIHLSTKDIYELSDQHGIAMDGLVLKGILQQQNRLTKPIELSMRGIEFIRYFAILVHKEKW